MVQNQALFPIKGVKYSNTQNMVQKIKERHHNIQLKKRTPRHFSIKKIHDYFTIFAAYI